LHSNILLAVLLR